MTTEPHALAAADFIDLQDLLLTVAENARLLVIGPLLVGALAYGVVHRIPPTFESTAVLRINELIVANELFVAKDSSPITSGMSPAAMGTLMTNNVVLTRSLKRLGQLEGVDEQGAEDLLDALRSNVKTQVARDSKLLTVSVTARSAEAAQKTAQAILETAFEEARPRGAEQSKLRTEIALGAQLLADLQSSSDALKTNLLQAKGDPNTDVASLAEGMAHLANARLSLQGTLHELERRAAGVSEDSVMQPPTLPQRPMATRKRMLVTLSTLGAGLVLLVFVLVRQAWKSGTSTEQQVNRWLALRKSYGLKK